MKLRSPSLRWPLARAPLARPTRANGALLPALCAGLLAGLAGLQFAMTANPELPEPGFAGGGARSVLPLIAGSAVPEVLARSSIFAPTRTLQAKSEGGAPSPLQGASVAGAVSVRGRSYAVIQRADGQIVRLPVGGRIAGQRLVSLSPDGAIFQSGATRSRIPYGTTVAPAAAEPEAEETTE